MKIGDGYLLMLPGFVDGEENKIVLYEVQSMLDLQHSSQLLAGHPSRDLPAAAWGSAAYPSRRVLRWTARNRLVKAKLNAGGSVRLTFCEPKEWQKHLTSEQWQWLVQVCEVSELYKQKQARLEAQPEPVKPKVARKKKPKVKAKIRRKMNKRDLLMEGD